jgi:2-succinyl-5-enolpyruvyl-6-hydroxy-3-cyclohexene-1-carboxylate synthase
MMAKLKTAQGLREVLSDPAIGLDLRKFVLDEVRAMMDDERLTPEERESRDAKRERDELKTWKEQREQSERDAAQKAKNEALANQTRREIISAMDKFPDIPKTQATMDAVIQNMRAAFRKYGKHLTPDQAMTVYSQQYWQSLQSVIEKLDPDVIVKKFGQKTLDKIQKLKLQELKDKTDPGKKSVPGETANLSKKKNLTEREYDKLFTQRLAGL